jgi:hypothetical protein
LIEARMAVDQSFTRVTSPTIDERQQTSWGTETVTVPPYEKISLCRSADHGRTWTSTIIRNSTGADKTALAVDNSSESPFHGYVYGAWSDIANEEIAFVRSTDAGQTAEPATRLRTDTGGSGVQLAVGPDGTVHMLWTVAFWNKANRPSGRRTPIFYSRSIDGGTSFSAASVVAEHGGLDGMASIELASAPDGSLLAVWAEADAPATARGVQPRSTVHWTHSEDGAAWSKPAPLTRSPLILGQGLATAASTESAWHILSYDAGAHETTVRIYTASHDSLDFKQSRTLATRAIGFDDIYLHTSYQLRWAFDMLNVGDYVGLAGVASSLASAIVLPEADKLAKPTALATVETQAWTS